MASRLTVALRRDRCREELGAPCRVVHHLRGSLREPRAARGAGARRCRLRRLARGSRRSPARRCRRRGDARARRHAAGADEDAPLAGPCAPWQELLGGDVYVVLDQLEEHFLYHRRRGRPGTFAVRVPGRRRRAPSCASISSLAVPRGVVGRSSMPSRPGSRTSSATICASSTSTATLRARRSSARLPCTRSWSGRTRRSRSSRRSSKRFSTRSRWARSSSGRRPRRPSRHRTTSRGSRRRTSSS